jgi:hypothetical protein
MAHKLAARHVGQIAENSREDLTYAQSRFFATPDPAPLAGPGNVLSCRAQTFDLIEFIGFAQNRIKVTESLVGQAKTAGF